MANGKRETFPVIREEDLAAPMRDGVLLRADAYRPDAPGRFPTLLCRTPYNKQRNQATAQRLAERGYLVVVQDVRGRYASDGEFRPGFFSADHSDAEDGYDAVEWAARLPWSTGKVGTFGGSYEGWTQWAMAHTRPPHLVAMIPSAIAASLLDRELSGVLRLGRVLDWTINNLSVDTARRLGDPYKPRTQDEARRLWVERDRLKWLWYLPLMDIPEEAMPGMGRHWRRWLEDHAADHFRFQERHREVNVPALSVTGWYDQQIGNIKHFTGMRQNGMTEQARRNQRLIIGPWTHTLADLGRKLGDVDFGPEACRDYFEIADRWYSCWLKGEGPGLEDWPPVQVFVMGANRWRAENEWPLTGTVYTDVYLHSQGRANIQAGDLSRQPPQQEPPDEYTYDPRDPVMTLYTPAGQHAPLDQRALDGRRDVLVYATPPLEQPLEVIGPVTVKLWAASSARDTDFVVKLLDIWPDGFAQELCHGIVRARYRESFDRPSLIQPGQAYEYTIQVNPTGNLFRPGHRVRLDVSSSDFPNFDRNHNTGGDDYRESALQTARQTIFHDAARPSRLILPVIP
jgi:putative CocE/NonD family hydrolase